MMDETMYTRSWGLKCIHTGGVTGLMSKLLHILHCSWRALINKHTSIRARSRWDEHCWPFKVRQNIIFRPLKTEWDWSCRCFRRSRPVIYTVRKSLTIIFNKLLKHMTRFSDREKAADYVISKLMTLKDVKCLILSIFVAILGKDNDKNSAFLNRRMTPWRPRPKRKERKQGGQIGQRFRITESDAGR